MKKFFVLFIVCVVTISGFAIQAFAEYDQEKVVSVMRASGAAMGAIKKALKASDFFTVAENLMVIATGMNSLNEVTPPTGSQEHWVATHQSLIKAALKGIGACGEEDAEKVGMYVGEIGKLIKEGHGMFK